VLGDTPYRGRGLERLSGAGSNAWSAGYTYDGYGTLYQINLVCSVAQPALAAGALEYTFPKEDLRERARGAATHLPISLAPTRHANRRTPTDGGLARVTPASSRSAMARRQAAVAHSIWYVDISSTSIDSA